MKDYITKGKGIMKMIHYFRTVIQLEIRLIDNFMLIMNFWPSLTEFFLEKKKKEMKLQISFRPIIKLLLISVERYCINANR